MFFVLSDFLTFSIITIFDWLKLLQESKVENAIYFVFLEICKQKFEVTKFEFPTQKLLLSPKLYLPPFHCMFMFSRTYFPCYCFDFVVENGGC